MRLRFQPRTSRDVPWVNYSVVDALWGIAAPLIAILLRDVSMFDAANLSGTIYYAILGGFFTGIIFIWFRLSYSVTRFFSTTDALQIVKASALAVVLTVFAWFLLTRLENVPRSVPFLHFIVLASGNIAGRAISRLRHRRRDRTIPHSASENIVLVGVSEIAWHYIQFVGEFGSGRQQIVALLDENRSLQGRFIHGYSIAGRPQDLTEVIEEYKMHGVDVHKVVLACAPDSLSDEASEVLFRVTKERNISLQILPKLLGLLDVQSNTRNEVGGDVAEIDSAVDRNFLRLKRCFDLMVSLILLLVMAPIFILVILLVLVDCGMPVFFWQVRMGRHGNRLTVYKFRTLKALYDGQGQPIPHDERLSAIGRFLRLSRLDELPQIFSILIGDMSLVGPRPLLPVDLPRRIGLRQAVNPGLTGWSQINGATLLSVDEKNALDEWYVRHASWALDAKILLATILLLFTGVHRNETVIAQALTEEAARATSNCSHA